jgi:hypothetical protein
MQKRRRVLNKRALSPNFLESYATFKLWQDLNKVATVNENVMLAYFHELVSVRSVSYIFVYAVKETWPLIIMDVLLDATKYEQKKRLKSLHYYELIN